MSWVWTFFLVCSIVSALIGGRTAALSNAVLEGAASGVTLSISLAGPLCLWSGLNNLMAQTGLTDRLSRLLSPLLQRIFPAAWQDKTCREAICANLSANLLGLGNAATPPGIQAAKRLSAHSPGTAGDELCRLVVMNTASIQLIPTTVAAVRASMGADAPFDILPAVWITSLCALSMGLLAAKGLSKWL